MSVRKDASGRRSVEMEFAVPGTPEQVWQAIATGPGISCWFAFTEVEEREGGALAIHLGPGMDSSGTVTAWEPPRRFAYEERDWLPGAPPVASEFLVEARSGGSCVVRVVHCLFASGDDWDDQLESFETGWPGFFRVLALYLTHFLGQPVSPIRVAGKAVGSVPEAWATLTGALGLAGAAVGQRRAASVPGAPPLSGIVERVAEGEVCDLLLRTEAPAPGLVLLGAYSWAGTVHVSISFYLYGDQAPAVVAREEPRWRAWIRQHFPQST